MKNKEVAIKMLENLKETVDWQEVDSIDDIINFINKNL